LAGFQVSIIGRIWVSTEGGEHRLLVPGAVEQARPVHPAPVGGDVAVELEGEVGDRERRGDEPDGGQDRGEDTCRSYKLHGRSHLVLLHLPDAANPNGLRAGRAPA